MADSSFLPTIGLEIHAELKTKTKMFCNSKNDPDEIEPNTNVCPVCMAHPGTLPVINREAVKHVLKLGIAVGGELANFTEFDRKNYFYPDIPKGYQISQYKYPLVTGGVLASVPITRVHLEEDTARSLHDQGDFSLVDFNRAGIPLMELVTEPAMHGVEEALFFARELQLLLRYLDISEANMEKGEMRIEANVSVGRNRKLGTKVELKNINSFRSMEKAVLYEIERQIEIIQKGESVVQETRGWDEQKQKTFSQRKKESSHDYRYFPEPDLPKLYISEIKEFKKENLQKEIPELPRERRERYEKNGIKKEDTDIFVRFPEVGNYMDRVLHLTDDLEVIVGASNLLANNLLSGVASETKFSTTLPAPEHLIKIAEMFIGGEISSKGVKDLLTITIREQRDPQELAKEHDLFQESDSSFINSVVDSVLEKQSDAFKEYKEGKEGILGFLIGEGMKESKGRANPKLLEKEFKNR